MKWKSHIAIAKAIADEADIHGELRQTLCDGVVDPDKSPDYKRTGKGFIRMTHHNPPASMIMSYIWDARYAHLRGDEKETMLNIGRALHYIQDKSVSKGFRSWTHDWRESAIAKLDPPKEQVRLGFQNAESCPEFVRNCITSVNNKKNAERAMRIATYYSSAIFAAVISSPEDGGNNRMKHIQNYKRHSIVLKITFVIGIAMIALFALGEFRSGAAVAIIFFLTLIYNRDYKDVKRGASWYRLI